MVEVGQPGPSSVWGPMSKKIKTHRPATTHPVLPPPHTMISNSSGNVPLILNKFDFPLEIVKPSDISGKV